MVTDALRYWADRLGVDGFRIDLASVLGRPHVGPVRPALARCSPRSRPTRCCRSRKLIAEPWDATGEGYRVGGFGVSVVGVERPLPRHRPRLLARARRDRRAGLAADRQRGPLRPVRPAAVGVGQLRDRARRLHPARPASLRAQAQRGQRRGQPRRHRRQPLAELRCRGRDRLAGDPGRAARQAARAMLGTLLLSTGVPMLLGGDELWRTQGGNNNAYCLDDPTSWVGLVAGRGGGPDGVRRPPGRDPPLVGDPAPRPLLPRRRRHLVALLRPPDGRGRLARPRRALPGPAGRRMAAAPARGEAGPCTLPPARPVRADGGQHLPRRHAARAPPGARATAPSPCPRQLAAAPASGRPAQPGCAPSTRHARNGGRGGGILPPCRATTSAAASARRPSRSTGPWPPPRPGTLPHRAHGHGQAAQHRRPRRPRRRGPRPGARGRGWRRRLLRGRLLRLSRRLLTPSVTTRVHPVVSITAEPAP